MRWIQVTLCVTLKSYTYFKPLDLSRSNGQKKTLINANILIRISLIIPYLLYFMCISKPKKSVIFDSLYISLSWHSRNSLDSVALFAYIELLGMGQESW